MHFQGKWHQFRKDVSWFAWVNLWNTKHADQITFQKSTLAFKRRQCYSTVLYIVAALVFSLMAKFPYGYVWHEWNIPGIMEEVSFEYSRVGVWKCPRLSLTSDMLNVVFFSYGHREPTGIHLLSFRTCWLVHMKLMLRVQAEKFPDELSSVFTADATFWKPDNYCG